MLKPRLRKLKSLLKTATRSLGYRATSMPDAPAMAAILAEYNELKEKLRLLNERHNLAVKATHDMLWDWDIEKNIIYRNEAGLRAIYGPDRGDLLHEVNDWICRIHPEDRPQVVAQLESIKQHLGPELFKAEYRFLREDGTYMHIYDRGYVMKDETGRPVRMIGAAQDVTEQIQTHRQLIRERALHHRELMKATITAQEKSRKEIAHELHDNVNQLLGAAKLYLEAIPGDRPHEEEYRTDSVNLIMKAIEEIRTLTRSLTPPMLTEAGLIATVQDLVDRIKKLQVLQLTFSYKNVEEQQMDNGLQLAIYRIIQEQVNNTLKHAQASELTIQLVMEGRTIRLIITDNGVGFEPSESRKGVGFTNILTRATAYNGSVEMRSASGNGCTLIVNLECPI